MQTPSGQPEPESEGTVATAVAQDTVAEQEEEAGSGQEAGPTDAVSSDTLVSDTPSDTTADATSAQARSITESTGTEPTRTEPTGIEPTRMPAARPASDPEPETPADRTGNRVVNAVTDRFRLPRPEDPEPSTARLLTVSAWAAVLGLLGLIPGARLVVEWLFFDLPGAVFMTVMLVGLLGMITVSAAFAAIHRDRLPWALLGTGTVLLLINLTLTYTAL